MSGKTIIDFGSSIKEAVDSSEFLGTAFITYMPKVKDFNVIARRSRFGVPSHIPDEQVEKYILMKGKN